MDELSEAASLRSPGGGTRSGWRPGPGRTWFPGRHRDAPPPGPSPCAAAAAGSIARGGAGGSGGAVASLVAGIRARSQPGTDVVIDYSVPPPDSAGVRYMWPEQARLLALQGRRLGGDPKCVDGAEVLVDLPPDDDVVSAWGPRRALLVGVDYRGQECELGGGAHDVCAAQEFLVSAAGFPPGDVRVLCEAPGAEPPTRDAVLQQLQWLSAGAMPGDCIFLLFSGHGGRSPVGDGYYEETLLPVDHAQSGPLRGADIDRTLLAPLPRGCRLTVVIDCARGGSPFDLPYALPCTARRLAAARGCDNPRLLVTEVPAGRHGTAAEVAVLSSERDPEETADEGGDAAAAAHAAGGGACLHALIAGMWRAPLQPALALLGAMREDFRRRGVYLAPRLSSTRCYDLQRQFRVETISIPADSSVPVGPSCRCGAGCMGPQGAEPGGWHCSCCRRLGVGPRWSCAAPGCQAQLCFVCAPPQRSQLPPAWSDASIAGAQRGAQGAGELAGEAELWRRAVRLLRPFGTPGVGTHAPAGAEGMLSARGGRGFVRFVLDIPGRGAAEVPERDVGYLLVPAAPPAAGAAARGGAEWPPRASGTRAAAAAGDFARGLAELPPVGSASYRERLSRAQRRHDDHYISGHRAVRPFG